MLSLLYVVFVFLTLSLGGLGEDVKVGDIVQTSMRYNNITPLHYLRLSYKSFIYAFSVDFFNNEGFNIAVSKSSDHGKTWQVDRNAIVSPNTFFCNLYSSYVIDNTIFLFFYSGKNYMVKSEDGLQWTEPKEFELPQFYGSGLYISGTPVDIFGDEHKYIYICTKTPHEMLHNMDIKLKCVVSFDAGDSWSTPKYVRLISDLDLTHYFIRDGFFFRNNLYLNVSNSERNEIFKCSEMNKYDVHCKRVIFEQLGTHIIIAAGVISDYLSFIVSNEQGESFLAISYDGVSIIIHNKKLPTSGYYQFITNEGNGYLFLMDNYFIHVTPVTNLPLRKAGCEFVTDSSNENTVYYNKFVTRPEENGVYHCNMRYLDSATSDDGLYKLFHVRVTNDVEFDDNCFAYSFDIEEKHNILDDETLSREMHKTRNNTAKIIQMKNIENVSSSPDLKDIDFYFPAHFRNIFFNGMTTKCSSKDKKLHIHFTFDNVRNTLEVVSSAKEKERGLVINTRVHTLNKVKRNIYIPSTLFPTAEKEKMKNDYSVYDNMVLKLSACSSLNETNRITLPKGTYMIKSTPCYSEYVISNYIPNMFIIDFVQSYKNVLNGTYLYAQRSGKRYNYEGVDFMNFSFNYMPLKKELRDKNDITVVVSNFSSEKTIGMICPIKTMDSFSCFDKVYNEENQLVPIHSVFKREGVFVIPKRKIINEKESYLETLLYMDTLLVKDMRKNRSIVSFTCKCMDKGEIRNVTYVISPYFERSYIIKDVLNGRAENVQDENTFKNSSTEQEEISLSTLLYNTSTADRNENTHATGTEHDDLFLEKVVMLMKHKENLVQNDDITSTGDEITHTVQPAKPADREETSLLTDLVQHTEDTQVLEQTLPTTKSEIQIEETDKAEDTLKSAITTQTEEIDEAKKIVEPIIESQTKEIGEMEKMQLPVVATETEETEKPDVLKPVNTSPTDDAITTLPQIYEKDAGDDTIQKSEQKKENEIKTSITELEELIRDAREVEKEDDEDNNQPKQENVNEDKTSLLLLRSHEGKSFNFKRFIDILHTLVRVLSQYMPGSEQEN